MIAVVTAMWQRPQISRIFCEGIERLKRETGMDLQIFAAVSEQDSLAVCIDYKAHPVFTLNNPLGAKWNASFDEAMKHKPDAVLIMGDDDLISTQYFKQVINSDHHAIGLSSLYFANVKTGDTVLFEYRNKKTIGAGRYIPAAVLDKIKRCRIIKKNNERLTCNSFERDIRNRDNDGMSIEAMDFYSPFDPEINSSLDYSFELNLARAREKFISFQSDKVHCIDIKAGSSVTDFGRVKEMGKPVTLEAAMWFLSDKEKGMIKKLKS